MRSRLITLAATAVAVAVVGCGPGSSADVTQIRHVIAGFSEASGAGGCRYLTTGALNELYSGNGHVTNDRSRALAVCAARSRDFKGAPVEIGRVWFPQDSRTASAFAHAPGGHPRWQLYLHKVGGEWQIAHIQH